MTEPDARAALLHYDMARNWIARSKFYQEVLRQHFTNYDNVTETSLLREHAWVTLNSGFRETVVRRRFDYISLCFCDWESAASISEAGDACVLSAKVVFGNLRKLRAIARAASIIHEESFESFFKEMMDNPLGTLKRLPYMGEITAIHLAKNLGLNVVKPDRHLVRVAIRFGYSSPLALCEYLAAETGDEEKVVDLVLWRFEQQTSADRSDISLHLPFERPIPTRGAA
ncbi:MAG: hypothetical protein HY834_10095 [Devosia nanyangense]|uniref:Uncharacterized protein n=1 Tax=Devosia nanyangense TaxID=1228055 RepID=A0A933L4B3_9HYPH|nr:hypothetical protein [Devosia nanyangense]